MDKLILKDRKIFVFMDGSDGEIAITPNFKAKEFFCKCNHEHPHFLSVYLVECLQKLRDEINRSLKINSGYRCKEHNYKIGGASESQHMRGLALDVKTPDGMTPKEVEKIAHECGFTWGYSGKGFTHLDVRTDGTVWHV